MQSVELFAEGFEGGGEFGDGVVGLGDPGVGFGKQGSLFDQFLEALEFVPEFLAGLLEFGVELADGGVVPGFGGVGKDFVHQGGHFVDLDGEGVQFAPHFLEVEEDFADQFLVLAVDGVEDQKQEAVDEVGQKDENGRETRTEDAGDDLPLVEGAGLFEVQVGEAEDEDEDEEGGEVKRATSPSRPDRRPDRRYPSSYLPHFSFMGNLGERTKRKMQGAGNESVPFAFGEADFAVYFGENFVGPLLGGGGSLGEHGLEVGLVFDEFPVTAADRARLSETSSVSSLLSSP